MNNIQITGLCKSFGEKQVFKDFSYTFPGGETTCIMGKSGCGKTTLINILLGLTSADSGSISGIPKEISCVFQEDRLCEDFSVLSNIRLTCKKHPETAEIEKALQQVGLKDASKLKVSSLSGGMKRRVAIIRALLAPSELLILDEPFKGLDGETKLLTEEFVKSSCKGKTVIIITHDEEEAVYFGGRLLKLSSPEKGESAL